MNEPTWYSFGEYVLHAGRRELMRGGVTVDLGSRATEILLALLRRPGEVATKAAIMGDVWPGLAVAENNLTTQMAQVRRALDDPDGRRFIRTVPGRGYRFIADIIQHTTPPQAPSEQPALVRHNLPIESSSFIGRERELAEIAARLAGRALVTVVGAAGVGKTRAALKIAADNLERFADGVLLLELAPLSDEALVAELLCRKLGAPASNDRSAVDTCVSVLRASRMLLVLDNCEHVLGGVAVLADSILRRCPGVRLLATSREALNVPGEVVFRLPSLSVPQATGPITAAAAMQSEAVQLFVQRAADSLGSYVLSDDDAPAVVMICRRLEGMPLAMELAAARLSMMNPAEIAAGLEDVFSLLNVGSRTAEKRHQTLYATIDWSFRLLSLDEQVLLRRLAIFTNGCSLEGAIAVAAGDDIQPAAVFNLLSALVGKSLVVPDTSGPATRYRMLETTQKYAADKLAEAGETGLVRRLSSYLLGLFRHAEAAWPKTPTDPWLATYGPEAENLRAAIDWVFREDDPACGVALVAVAGALADERSMQPDLRRWTQAALPHLGLHTPGAEAASVLYLRTMLDKRLGAHEVPGERLQAIQLFRESGDAVGLSRALRQTAMARAMPGPRDPVVLAMAMEAVSLLRHLAPHKDLATALAHLGSVHFLAGEDDAARQLNEEAASMRRALGDRTGSLASSVNLAELLFLDGDVSGALAYAAEAESEARRRNALPTLALILNNLAGYRLHDDQVEAAIEAVIEALSLSRAIGQDYLTVMCLEHLALAHALRGNLDLAARGLGFTDAHYRAGSQTRERVEQMGYDRLLGLLQSGLPRPRLEALMAAGTSWTAQAADAALLPVS